MPKLNVNLIVSDDGSGMDVVRLFADLPQATVAHLALGDSARELPRGLGHLKRVIDRAEEEQAHGAFRPRPLWASEHPGNPGHRCRMRPDTWPRRWPGHSGPAPAIGAPHTEPECVQCRGGSVLQRIDFERHACFSGALLEAELHVVCDDAPLLVSLCSPPSSPSRSGPRSRNSAACGLPASPSEAPAA